MKRIFIVSFIFVSIISCNSNDSKDGKKGSGSTEEKKDPDAALSSNPDYEKGLVVVAKSGCLTCHKVDEKVTGPSYRDVANKYAGMGDTIVAHLASKVISGGSGVWGEIPMIPHPALTKEDAEAAVKYILLLKK